MKTYKGWRVRLAARGRLRSWVVSGYQDFKFRFVANWGDEWEISEQEIRDWAAQREKGTHGHASR